MDVKKIGSVLMVGLLLLSAVVALTGTAAATSNWPIQFEGTILGVAAGTDVEIVRTVSAGSYTYTQTWSGNTDGSGYFITGKAVFSDNSYPGSEPHYPTSGDYQMYIGGAPDEKKFIGISDGIDYYNSDEVKDPYGFIWFGNLDCYYRYTWHKQGEIPEFSTIAIPIVSIVGLLFLFNRRKHRNE
jgi:hypothetical protein